MTKQNLVQRRTRNEQVMEFPDSLNDSQELRKLFEKRRKTVRGLEK